MGVSVRPIHVKPPWPSPARVKLAAREVVDPCREGLPLIGRITGLEVQSLTVSPQETAVPRTPDAPDHGLPLTLLRMDFAARVHTDDGGERQVLIEIQKANAPTVIERFRRYLGQQERQRAQRAERAQQQAEQERRPLLAQAIRRLHGLGQDAEAIAAALAVDADEVRRVLSG